jgi:hypothetical protein
MIEEHYLDASAAELIEQQRLQREFAGQTVRRVDIETVDGGVGDLITQTLQGWSPQRRATDAIVDKAGVLLQSATVLMDAMLQFGYLAGDGVGLGLLIGRDPGIQGHT